MNGKNFWCAVCNKMVAVVIEEGASAMLAPLVGGAAGSAVGGAKLGVRGGLVGAVVGALAGLVVHAMIPKAQHVVCGQCHTHLA